jgi:predicted TIM-barrel fold metal-dependent hydrolase
VGIIDADAHVVEIEHTWDFLGETEQQYRPVRVTQVPPAAQRDYWLIDGKLHPGRFPGADPAMTRSAGLGDKVVTPEDSRFLIDVQARIRHMDELGTDIQVLYPTIFINPFTERPAVELALTRSYNRWLAEIWQQGGGRLRWAAALPLLSMDKVPGELQFAKENGACAIFMRGIECGNKLLSDPYFFPLYEEASKLDLPICVHTGNGSQELSDLFAGENGFCKFKLVGVGAFHNLLMNAIPAQFPGLRFAFVELSSQWLPYTIHDLTRRLGRMGRPLAENPLRDNRIYVTCQTDDDLPEVIRYVGEDNLVIGTDYGHADTSSEIYALQTFKQQHEHEPALADKILDRNARALYGL